ncbi:MAG: GNAT family N-acetyltransferase [Promethearchaeota archaeon]
MIKKTLNEINSKDYSQEIIKRLCEQYTSDHLIKLTKEYHFFVMVIKDKIVGTIILKDNLISTLFVHPEFMKRGIGRKLMVKAETMARKNHVKNLQLFSSLTAKDFYLKLGYKLIEKNVDENVGITFLMEKNIEID